MTESTNELTPNQINVLLNNKYRLVYSERLGRKVYTLIEWIDKSIFKRHKKLFGYTDIGWTVKHPKQLIRALCAEGIWDIPQIKQKSETTESDVEEE